MNNPNEYIAEMFQDTPDNQKIAIINFLMGTGSESDNSKAISVLNSYVDIFKVSSRRCMERLKNVGVAGTVADLNQMTLAEKEFLVVAANEMLRINGKPTMNKLEETVIIFEKIGISQGQFLDILQKMDALNKYFNE